MLQQLWTTKGIPKAFLLISVVQTVVTCDNELNTR
jgi:hypothetical protein